MRKEFFVERQGRSFVLYQGLLDLGHQHGLKSIQTELIQVPSEANNGVAIARATVVMEREGVERVFTGIGDAAINNVAPAMQTCLIRMAETRSKARALRDAVNVGVAAFEELGDEGAHDGAPERGYAVHPTRVARATAGATNRNGGPAGRTAGGKSEQPTSVPAEMRNRASQLMTEAQKTAILSMSRRLQIEPADMVRERFSVEGVDALTERQASELIRALNDRNNARATAAS